MDSKRTLETKVKSVIHPSASRGHPASLETQDYRFGAAAASRQSRERNSAGAASVKVADATPNASVGAATDAAAENVVAAAGKQETRHRLRRDMNTGVPSTTSDSDESLEVVLMTVASDVSHDASPDVPRCRLPVQSLHDLPQSCHFALAYHPPAPSAPAPPSPPRQTAQQANPRFPTPICNNRKPGLPPKQLQKQHLFHPLTVKSEEKITSSYPWEIFFSSSSSSSSFSSFSSFCPLSLVFPSVSLNLNDLLLQFKCQQQKQQQRRQRHHHKQENHHWGSKWRRPAHRHHVTVASNSSKFDFSFLFAFITAASLAFMPQTLLAEPNEESNTNEVLPSKQMDPSKTKALLTADDIDLTTEIYPTNDSLCQGCNMDDNTNGESNPDWITKQETLLAKQFKSEIKVRPVLNYNDTVSVSVSLVLLHIFKLDEKLQVLHSTFYAHFTWKDYSSRWKPKDYMGITRISVPVNRIWLPDIVLLNTAEDMVSFHKMDSFPVRVEYNGTVVWTPTINSETICRVRIIFFPFDTQTCEIKLASWTQPKTEVHLNAAENKIRMDLFNLNSEWSIEETIVKAENQSYPYYENEFSELYFSVKMSRKPLVQIFQLVLPCILLYLLILMSFWLPQDNPGKAGLATTVYLASSVQLLVVVDYTPPSSTFVPILGIYYALNSVMAAVAALSSVFVLHLRSQWKEQFPPPWWLKAVTKLNVCTPVGYLIMGHRHRAVSEVSTPSDQHSASDDVNVLTDDARGTGCEVTVDEKPGVRDSSPMDGVSRSGSVRRLATNLTNHLTPANGEGVAAAPQNPYSQPDGVQTPTSISGGHPGHPGSEGDGGVHTNALTTPTSMALGVGGGQPPNHLALVQSSNNFHFLVPHLNSITERMDRIQCLLASAANQKTRSAAQQHFIESIQKEWFEVAIAVERVFFCIYLVVLLFSPLILLKYTWLENAA